MSDVTKHYASFILNCELFDEILEVSTFLKRYKLQRCAKEECVPVCI